MPSTAVIAYFITPHGFGHASRAAAVMSALQQLNAGIRFELFTTSPHEIFAPEIPGGFGYHSVSCDIGMVQTSPLLEDIPATCSALNQMLPFDDAWVDRLANQLIRLNCRLVICDIAPLGIAAAHRAGIASLLIENFTWDWIYRGYLAQAPELAKHIQYLADVFALADHHIQTRPLCRPLTGSTSVGPISRRARNAAAKTRTSLGIPEQDQMVLISMGGVPDTADFIHRLPDTLPCHLVLCSSRPDIPTHGQVIGVPVHSSYYHPDLILAADAVIGKAGYSTISEAYHAGVPFGYVTRPHSPESAVLEKFIARHMPSRAIAPEDYQSGEWIDHLPELLQLAPGNPADENGARAAARIIEQLIK